ncbi:hypothetical protein RRG08_057689 [Elysia crispata]|uniref:Uncharacterized protein n=1 Tax=Elysia crispata TaxID=231223 RepID=A0AAE1AFV7_9GAST|nr:hypothetical protein RRG08_057689 [Elysia crispata]
MDRATSVPAGLHDPAAGLGELDRRFSSQAGLGRKSSTRRRDLTGSLNRPEQSFPLRAPFNFKRFCDQSAGLKLRPDVAHSNPAQAVQCRLLHINLLQTGYNQPRLVVPTSRLVPGSTHRLEHV